MSKSKITLKHVMHTEEMYNKSLVIEFKLGSHRSASKSVRCLTGFGSSDDIQVFHVLGIEDPSTYIAVATSKANGLYASCAVFDYWVPRAIQEVGDDPELYDSTNDLFLQGEEADEALGPDWCNEYHEDLAIKFLDILNEMGA